MKRYRGFVGALLVLVGLAAAYSTGRDHAYTDAAAKILEDARQQLDRPRKRHWMIDGFWWESSGWLLWGMPAFVGLVLIAVIFGIWLEGQAQ